MKGIRVLRPGDGLYPGLLMNIYDPPAVLYCKGGLKRSDMNAVAIVGARRCSLYGLQMAEKLAFDLAKKGVTIISGMARGIDSAAHRGAIRAGGRTIAVMGSGFNDIYPPEAGKIIPDICKNGAVLTEYDADMPPLKHNFPRRNRIISGMSKGVVVVEAARRSGAMITVEMALQQGREVFAVPGRADSCISQGTHHLIKTGAKLVITAEDVLEEICLEPVENLTPDTGPLYVPRDSCPVKSKESLDKDEQEIMELLKDAPMHVDYILDQSGMGHGSLSKVLLQLEIKGLIKSSAGKRYVLNERQATSDKRR